MTEPDLVALVSRVDHLERAHRRLRGLVILALVAATAWAAIGPSPRPGLAAGAATEASGPVVAAERFVLRDTTGRVGAALGWQDGTPGLILYDRRGTARAQLVVGPDDAPGLALLDSDGKPRIAFALFRRGEARPGAAPPADTSPGLVLFDPSAKPRVALRATPGAGATLELSDPTGEPRATLGVQPGGLPALRLVGTNGIDRVSLGVLSDDTPALNLYNDSGRARAALAIRATGAAGLALADKDGQVVWSAP
jgi:hypothetical protein